MRLIAWWRPLLAGAGLAVLCGLAEPAHAGSVLDRVRSEGVVRCGAPIRPGLAEQAEPGGEPGGLLVALCRAVAAAALGPDAPIAFGFYDPDGDFDAARAGRDEVVFLDASEVAARGLAGHLVPGPAVYVQTTAVMVKDDAPAKGLADLAGQPICFLQGEAAQRHLEAWFADRHLPFIRAAYQENVEMWDAFDAGACRGIAGETTGLAAAQRGGEGRPPGGRLLPDTLAAFPILAMTGTADAQWTALVFWTLDAVIAAATPSASWRAGAADALPVVAPELGLTEGWQARVLTVTGTYAEMLRHALGADSPYRLPAGPNAGWTEGGALLAPHAE